MADFEQLESGKKSIETRAATVRNQNIEVGDQLEISCGPKQLFRTVKGIQHYDSVESIFQSADWNRVMPEVETLDDAKAVYYAWPGYREKIDQHGILAFYLE